MSRTFVAVAIVFSFLFAANLKPVSACSGGAPLTVKGLLKQSDYVVKAHAVERDDAGQNVIIQVENYLFGGPGPEYLLLIQNNPIMTGFILDGRSPGGDCLDLARSLGPSDSFYAFLSRSDDGSYSVVTTLFNPYLYTFANSDSTEEVFLEGGFQNGEQVLEYSAERDTGQEVVEDEFVAVIEMESGESLTLPDQNSPYPLLAPLLITTSDEQYVLPVDWQAPYIATDERFTPQQSDLFGFYEASRCADAPQVETRFSPDGQNIATIGPDNTICFSWGHSVEGQAVLFSTTSDAVAVWNECQLSVYTLGYPRLLQPQYQIDFVNRVDLIGDNCSVFHQSAAWSPNGRLLAFADERGILLWDVFTSDGVPQQVITNSARTRAIPDFFSPQGRYLHYMDGNTRQYIDWVSGKKIPDGVVSPDERILIRFDTEADSSNFEICSLAPFSCVDGPLMSLWFWDSKGEMEKYYDLSEVSRVQWKDKSSFLALACTNDDYNRCAIFTGFASYHGWVLRLIGEAVGFDYDVPNNTLAYVRDARTIVVHRTELDMSRWFSEEILSVTWLPSLFYRE